MNWSSMPQSTPDGSQTASTKPPIGNHATGFFVIFALIAAMVGAAAALAGIYHMRSWDSESLPSAASSAFIAWGLTLLAMG